MMQRMEWNGGLCHGEQKANFHNSGKNDLKMFVFLFLNYSFCVFIFDYYISGLTSYSFP